MMSQDKHVSSLCCAFIVAVELCLLFHVQTAASQNCNMTEAERCVKRMETVLTRVLDASTAPDNGGSVEDVCLDIIKGNNLTQCYIAATSGCAVAAARNQTEFQPTETMQRWEQVMQDVYQVCDGACPSFLERTINITQCTSLIRFDSLYESSFDTFCRSLNASLECAAHVTEECPMFARLFYDILPQNMDTTASTICTEGCANFDESMTILDNCKVHIKNLPEDLDSACVAYRKFQTCLVKSNAPITCPMFESLMEVLYPKHIFGLYQRECNSSTSSSPDDGECGQRGHAKVQHCARVLALSWPASTEESTTVTARQCREFQTGIRCLDNAGFHRCESLRQFFDNITDTRREHIGLMQDRCTEILGDHDHRIFEGGQSPSDSAGNFGGPLAIFTSIIWLLASIFLTS